MANSDMITGFVLGVAATLVGRAVLNTQDGSGRPIVRALGRSAVMLGEKVQETAAELSEVFEDTIAEMQAQAVAKTDTDPPMQEQDPSQSS